MTNTTEATIHLGCRYHADASCGIQPGYCHCGCGQKTPLASNTDGDHMHVKNQPLQFVPGHLKWGCDDCDREFPELARSIGAYYRHNAAHRDHVKKRTLGEE